MNVGVASGQGFVLEYEMEHAWLETFDGMPNPGNDVDYPNGTVLAAYRYTGETTVFDVDSDGQMDNVTHQSGGMTQIWSMDPGSGRVVAGCVRQPGTISSCSSLRDTPPPDAS